MQRQLYTNNIWPQHIKARGASAAVSEQASLSIRLAVKSDSWAIASVHHQSLRTNFADCENKNLTMRNLDQLKLHWDSKFQSEKQLIGVLLKGEQIIGFASVGDNEDEVGSIAAGQICSLYLHPSAWGGGNGKLLIRWCEQALLGLGYTSCKLWVVDINERARRFYEKVGFVLDGTIKEENGVVLCRMHKTILPIAA